MPHGAKALGAFAGGLDGGTTAVRLPCVKISIADDFADAMSGSVPKGYGPFSARGTTCPGAR